MATYDWADNLGSLFAERERRRISQRRQKLDEDQYARKSSREDEAQRRIEGLFGGGAPAPLEGMGPGEGASLAPEPTYQPPAAGPAPFPSHLVKKPVNRLEGQAPLAIQIDPARRADAVMREDLVRQAQALRTRPQPLGVDPREVARVAALGEAASPFVSFFNTVAARESADWDRAGDMASRVGDRVERGREADMRDTRDDAQLKETGRHNVASEGLEGKRISQSVDDLTFRKDKDKYERSPEYVKQAGQKSYWERLGGNAADYETGNDKGTLAREKLEAARENALQKEQWARERLKYSTDATERANLQRYAEQERSKAIEHDYQLQQEATRSGLKSGTISPDVMLRDRGGREVNVPGTLWDSKQVVPGELPKPPARTAPPALQLGVPSLEVPAPVSSNPPATPRDRQRALDRLGDIRAAKERKRRGLR